MYRASSIALRLSMALILLSVTGVAAAERVLLFSNFGRCDIEAAACEGSQNPGQNCGNFFGPETTVDRIFNPPGSQRIVQEAYTRTWEVLRYTDGAFLRFCTEIKQFRHEPRPRDRNYLDQIHGIVRSWVTRSQRNGPRSRLRVRTATAVTGHRG